MARENLITKGVTYVSFGSQTATVTQWEWNSCLLVLFG